MWAHYYAKKAKAAINIDDEAAAPSAATAPVTPPTVEESVDAKYLH